MRLITALVCSSLLLVACSEDETTSGGIDTGAVTTDAGGDAADAAPLDVRGRRYCEILAGDVVSDSVKLDVWNTFGLNDCPDEAWRALTVAGVKTELGKTVVVLNGPRYWLISAFENSTFIDPTVRKIGGIEMRVAGRISVPLSTATGAKPYVDRSVERNTTFVFRAGVMVYELVDPTGRIFDMQSYSVQTTPQTEASLATLGDRLTLPTGWSFRARTLTEDLRVTAVSGVATIVTDDFGNTYQLSQQTM
jgi:hypothetical protein